MSEEDEYIPPSHRALKQARLDISKTPGVANSPTTSSLFYKESDMNVSELTEQAEKETKDEITHKGKIGGSKIG